MSVFGLEAPRGALVMWLAGLLIAATVSGCTDGGPPGLAPDARIVTLTDEEWRTFCEWQSQLYLAQYDADTWDCDGSSRTHDATVSTCVTSGRAGAPADCPVTVESYARCVRAEAAARCASAAALPECDNAFCPPE